MKHKLKSGIEVELSVDDLKDIHYMYEKEYEEHEEVEEYYHKMKEKAHTNLQIISGDNFEDEDSAKEVLACMLRCGTYEEVGEFLFEMMEYVTARQICNSPKYD